MSETGNINYGWSRRIVSQLYSFGVKTVCISPGSRNTPLILAFLEHGKYNCVSHVDERSGAFFALGVALKTQKPVAILSTSGTATANFLPAVIEASQSRVSLIIITADRPPNLIGTGANQTILQKDIYGYYVRSSKDLGLPSDEFRNVDFQEVGVLMKQKVLFDGRNIYQPELIKRHGFMYKGMGRQ